MKQYDWMAEDGRTIVLPVVKPLRALSSFLGLEGYQICPQQSLNRLIANGFLER